MARRYATALADVVIAHGEAREVQDELSAWETMMVGNADLLEVFRNPTVPSDQKRKVLSALISRSRIRPTTANFLNVLLQNHRLADLAEINRQFARALDDRSGVVVAEVTTARPVSSQAQQALSERLSSLTGRSVRLQFAVNEDLIGGVMTRIGSTVYDGSVRSQLAEIRQHLAGEQ